TPRAHRAALARWSATSRAPVTARGSATRRATPRTLRSGRSSGPCAGRQASSDRLQTFSDQLRAPVGIVVPGEEAARGRDTTSGLDLVDRRLAGSRREELVVFGPDEQQRHGEAGELGVAENELGAGCATHEEAPQQRSVRRGLPRQTQREEVQVDDVVG